MSYSPCCLAVVCACVTLFTSGSEVLYCDMTATWMDLRGLLQWDCPVQMANTTYTVQKMTQGENRWEAVDGCVRVMSRSCDISRAFAEFDLYNWIRLGQEDALGSMQWSKPRMFDPLNETDYSPPSLSVSLQGLNVVVNVTMACSPIRACPPRECCSLSEILHDFCTSITVYSESRLSKPQTHENCAMEEKVSYEFTGLLPGQRYCVVANFTSSPVSSPQCIDLPIQIVSESLRPLWFLGAVLFMLIPAIPVIYYLRQQWTSAENHLPRALESLQNEESMELGAPCEDFQEDFGGDHISVLSQSPLESHFLTLSTLSEAQTNAPNQWDGYCNNPLPMDTGSGQIASVSEGMEGGLELSDNTLLPQCAVAHPLSQELRGSPPLTHTWSTGIVPGPPKLPPPMDNLRCCVVAQDIPLHSVRLGVSEEEEQLEDTRWFHLKNPSAGGT